MRKADTALSQAARLSAAGAWPSARQSAKNASAAVSQGVLAQPVRKGAGDADVNLEPLLQAFQSGPMARLDSALASRDKAATRASFTAVHAQCTSCHAASGKPETKLLPLLMP